MNDEDIERIVMRIIEDLRFEQTLISNGIGWGIAAQALIFLAGGEDSIPTAVFGLFVSLYVLWMTYIGGAALRVVRARGEELMAQYSGPRERLFPAGIRYGSNVSHPLGSNQTIWRSPNFVVCAILSLGWLYVLFF